MISLGHGLFAKGTLRKQFITVALFAAMLGGLLGFTTTFLTDFYAEATMPPSSVGELPFSSFFLAQHLPDTAFTKGRPYNPFRWSSPAEPLMLQWWCLHWLKEEGGRAGQIAAWTALVAAWIAYGVDWVRAKQKAQKT